MKHLLRSLLTGLWLYACCGLALAQQAPLVPAAIVAHGDKLLLGTTTFDGRGELCCVDKAGHTLWRADFNTFDIAVGPRYVYALGMSEKHAVAIRRYDLQSGALAPFEGRLTEAMLPLDAPAYSNTLGYGGGRLHVLLVTGETAHKAYRVDAESGAVTEMDKKGPLRAVTTLQSPRGDIVFILLADGSVIRDDLTLEPRAPKKLFTLKNVRNPVRLSVSADEKRFAISDYGRQVWVADGKGNVLPTLGRPHDGAKSGSFWPLGLSFDDIGNLWLAEAGGGFWNWSRGGKLGVSEGRDAR